MSSTSEGSGEGNGWKYGAGSAREFAKRRLSETDEPVSPAGLSRSYNCSGGHMRKVMAELVDEGEARRVGHGRYLPPEEEDSEREQGADASRETMRTAALEVEGEAVEEADEEADETDEEADGLDVGLEDDDDQDPDAPGADTASVEGSASRGSSGFMLVGATMVVALTVLLSSGSDGSTPDEPVDETGSDDGSESDPWEAFE